jgi:chemotaxis protein histidine kinase CheA
VLTITDRDPTPDLSAVARAEAALARLSTEFAGWMQVECDRLDAARVRARAENLRDDAREKLFRAAPDIKGQAGTFGYPLAAEAADSLCRLLEHTPDPSRVSAELIDQHVDGICAIIREDARESRNVAARALVWSLRRVTDEFLIAENRARPGYLDGIVAPPLSSG